MVVSIVGLVDKTLILLSLFTDTTLSLSYWFGALGGLGNTLPLYTKRREELTTSSLGQLRDDDAVEGRPFDVEQFQSDVAVASGEEKMATGHLATSTKKTTACAPAEGVAKGTPLGPTNCHIQGPEPLVHYNSWMQLARETLTHAALNGFAERGLWAEFGVASGKSAAYIGHFLAKNFGTPKPILNTDGTPKKDAKGKPLLSPYKYDDVKSNKKVKEIPILHGFDSFKGIPVGWNSLQQGTFSMGGIIPDIVANQSNIEIHVGWFNETKTDLDDRERHLVWRPSEDGTKDEGEFGAELKPFSFIHMDMDIYPAAREILMHYSCRLLPGTILLFDELINYVGWQADGEYRALREVAALRGILWEPLGIYHEQAVPIIIVENRKIGC